MKIINGIKHSQNLIESVKELVLKSERLHKRKPSIAVILIGANSASEIYVKNKIKTAENIGIISPLRGPPSRCGRADVEMRSRLPEPTTCEKLVSVPNKRRNN